MEKIVIFDAYGTLFQLDTDDERLDKELGEKKGEFFSLWRRKLLEYTWLTTLMSNWEEFNSIVKKAVSHCCFALDLDEGVIQDIVLKIYEEPNLFSDVLPTLEALNQAGHNCNIMSNGELNTLIKATERNKIDDYIKQIFSASTVQHFKVSKQVYRMATAHYNIGPGKMLFISSNAWDISGAQHFGYKTVWVNRDKQVRDTLTPPPTYEVNNLGALMDILN